MTVLSRGARVRRGGRRPGWLLLTALLVLAIGASSALVFTNRVELLKLAVILALWAAVVAAFVSVIYRRQSDADQARARDLKLVYDLQLDREISARREYELTVESQLRRELASELRSQAADEVAALRAELSALRTNLEILFDADLEHRPALETDRSTVRAYSDWDHAADGASTSRVSSSRVTAMHADSAAGRTDQNPIIDVPEVGVPAGFVADGYGSGYRAAEAYGAADAYARPDRGSHRRSDEGGGAPHNAGWPPQELHEPYSPQRPPPRPEPAAPPPYEPWTGAAPEPPAPPPGPRPVVPEPSSDWRPVGAEGQWPPPVAPGSNWAPAAAPAFEPAAGNNLANGSAAFREPLEAERPARHVGPGEPVPTPPTGGSGYPGTPREPAHGVTGGAESGWRYGGEGRRARARHYAESEASGPGAEPAAPAPNMSPPDLPPTPPPASARHRSADPDSDSAGPATGGQSVADLLARLQAGQSSSSGGRRRRREE